MELAAVGAATVAVAFFLVVAAVEPAAAVTFFLLVAAVEEVFFFLAMVEVTGQIDYMMGQDEYDGRWNI